MGHEWKDYISAADLEVMKDRLFVAYKAGFQKAKEIYSRRSSNIAPITNELDHFLWWLEEQIKDPKFRNGNP